MLFWFGITTFMCLILSLIFFISAILTSTDASDYEGRQRINSLLTSFIVFLFMYVVLSSLVIMLSIIKWAKNKSQTLRRIGNSETMINEIVTGSSESPDQF